MVMGAGALGSLIGGLLAHNGEDVILVGRRKHVDAVNSRGLRITGLVDETVQARASTQPVESDLIIFTVKSYDTREAAQALPTDDSTILTLQNGLGNAEIIADIAGEDRVLAGTTSMGSTFLEPGQIRYTGRGETRIGSPWQEDDNRVEGIVSMFNDAGIPAGESPDINHDLWAKLVVNAGINAPAYLTGLRNGELLEHEDILWLMRMVGQEAAAVARAEGIVLENPVERIIQVARDTAGNRCSMLQDRDRGRQTEINVINGAIVRRGKKHDIPTPVNRALLALVKGAED